MKTRYFKMGASRFLLEMIFRYAWGWMLALSALGVAGLVLGIAVDLRWLMVALLVLFVVAPCLLVFLYYYYGLRKESVVNSTQHCIVVENEGLKAILRHTHHSESNENEGKGESGEEDEVTFTEMFFPYESLQRFRVGHDSVVFPVRKPGRGFLWMPADSFETPEEMSEFLKIMDSKIDC